MRKALTIALVLIAGLASRVAPNPLPAATLWMYFDAVPVGESSRLYFDTEPGQMRVYVYLDFVEPTDGAMSVRFSAPKPPCLVGTWVGDEFGTVGVPLFGNSQTGVEILLLGCVSGSNHILTIVYDMEGLTGECCLYKAGGFPPEMEASTTTCGDQDYTAYGEYSLINPDANLCGVPVKQTTWSRIKALFQN